MVLREEIRLFFTALQFFTRVPVPAWVGWSPQQLNASARHFPSVGLLVGAVSAAVWVAAGQLWSPGVAAGLAMAASVWMTGAFHEDGFADSCDGFGGGHSPAQILAIMKDSRVGSYATVGVFLLLGLKWQLLVLAAPAGPAVAALVMLAAHSLSRWAALGVMARLDYAREDASSKSKPIAQGIAAGPLLAATAVALLPLGALAALDQPVGRLIAMALVAGAVSLAAVRWCRRRLGGYVGDALGATQQLAEVAVWLAWTAAPGAFV